MLKKQAILAVGDIHGNMCLLSDLLSMIDRDLDPDIQLVFLGDYIDRGPDSKAVVDTLLNLQKLKPATVFLRGNHEQMLMEALQGDNRDFYLRNGGQETIESYGLDIDHLNDFPRDHLAFLQDLPLFHVQEGYFFVHAGVRPGVCLKSQIPNDLLWIRDDFWEYDRQLEYKIVFGHTPFMQPYIRDNMIGIDTGAGYGGKLTALFLPDEKIHQFS